MEAGAKKNLVTSVSACRELMEEYGYGPTLIASTTGINWIYLA